MSLEMNNLLKQTAAALCRALEELLPPLSDTWWESCVEEKLSFQQRQRVRQRGISRLDQLDLSALIRLVDQNWYELADLFNWQYESRNFVKEMQTVRNRWAHSEVTAPPKEDVYRDLDTLHRFLALVCLDAELMGRVAEEKKQILTGQSEHQKKLSKSNSTQFSPGDVVRLVANPDKSGAVTSVHPVGQETRYQVFIDGKVGSFYESQLEVAETTADTDCVIPLQEFHARLTALQLLHPSVSKLYSLHAARIDPIPYQFRPVLKLIQSDRPRLLIADSVGVGKTIEAGLILRELQARRDLRRVLIVCPRPLVTEEKWRIEMKRFDESFEHLDGRRLRYCISETDLDGEWPIKYEKAILPFSLLTSEFLYGRGRRKGLLELDPPPQFDLVIVDEAHHIRNPETQRHQAVRFFCENAEAAVFLTATPIQLGEQDLFVLLNTLRPDVIIDQPGYNAITEPNVHINKAALLARAGESGWAGQAKAALGQAAETPWGKTVLQEDPRFQNIYDRLDDLENNRSMRVQSIREIEQMHTLSGLMNRTLRRDIGEFTQRKSETVTVDFTPEQRELHDAVLTAQASIYAALYGDKAVNFLLTTIRRQVASCIHGLAPLLRDILTRRIEEGEWDELADAEEVATVAADAVPRIRGLVNKALVLAENLPSDPARDPKFQALWKVLEQKKVIKNNKAMVFSTFRHTLAYLYDALRESGCRVGLIHGGVDDEERIALRARFEKDPQDPAALDVLLFSEVGCEGLDYQFCDCIVNYDLPWNPMRIDQRIGRIDRYGQTSEAVAIYNLITPSTVDADIYERCLLRIGVFERALGANEVILGKITQELTNVGENLMLTEEERQARLDQLADNSIRLVNEQRDLEKGQTELFGLRLPADQFRQDVEDATSYWLTPESIDRLVTHYLKSVTGKEDSPILGEGPKKTLRISRVHREALLADFVKLTNRRSTVAREWEMWLKGAKPILSVTYDSTYAKDDRTVTLITPIHPLALQAAQALEATTHGRPLTGFKVLAPGIHPGDYPFAVYQWQFHGIRRDIEFQPVTTQPELTADFIRLLPDGRECAVSSNDLSQDARDCIDRHHYRIWSNARTEHVEETNRLADFRRGSLETSHKARMAVLESQLYKAANERIRIMKAAQQKNAQADYERRSKEIVEATNKADITAKPIAWGIIRVSS